MKRRIIVVEDEPLIAVDIQQAATEADFDVVAVAHSLDEAISALDNGGIDGAVLDANLGGESVRPVIELLQQKGLRFVVVSGYTRDQIDFLDPEIPLMGKPFSTNQLISLLRSHLMPAA